MSSPPHSSLDSSKLSYIKLKRNSTRRQLATSLDGVTGSSSSSSVSGSSSGDSSGVGSGLEGGSLSDLGGVLVEGEEEEESVRSENETREAETHAGDLANDDFHSSLNLRKGKEERKKQGVRFRGKIGKKREGGKEDEPCPRE